MNEEGIFRSDVTMRTMRTEAGFERWVIICTRTSDLLVYVHVVQY